MEYKNKITAASLPNKGRSLDFPSNLNNMKKPISKLDEHTAEILTEMCRIVNVSPEKIDFGAENWYWKHTWTQKQQDDFSSWLEKYFQRWEKLTKKQAKDYANWFVMDFGWKLEK